MAYIDKETYEIWDDSNIDGQLDDCFEVDEAIAPVIRQLNLNGYKTKFCCSGHPTHSINEAFALADVPDPWKVLVGTVDVEKLDNGETRIIFIHEEDNLYISFSDISTIPVNEIPDGCYIDIDCLRYQYKSDCYFDKLRERADICEKLFLWADSLPKRAA